ncbi:MAG TPA: hypothetical protein VI485_15010 [Vicinamibacterales bacterium]|nr:hypothetical protein [Vicinamibacterales bacterium]
MAGASLIFRYQWRAFWRRVLRTGRVRFYLTILTVLGVMTARVLPDSLSQAAGELAAGQTASMDGLLLVLGLLWLVVLGENLNVSLSSDRLRRFPLGVRSLLALRLFSLFLSPIAWLATIVSLIGLSPLLSAPHPLLGVLSAFFFFALTIGVGMSVSQQLDLARWRRRLLDAGVALGAVAVAFALPLVYHDARPLIASLMVVNPATLVTTVAVATTPYAMAVPVATLLVGGAAVWYLFLSSFLRSLHGGTSERTARRATSIAWPPGRLGPLVLKEQRSVSGVLDLWMGLLLVLGVAALSLFVPLSSTVRQAVFVIVCAMNANVTLNCLGLDRPAGLTRYLILPISGKDLFLAKNVAVMMVVAVQLMLLLAVGAWQSGFIQLGAEIVVAMVLLLAHLGWGNVVSVFEPRRMEPHRFASAGDPVTASVSVLIGSTPGVAVIVLLRSDSRVTALAIAAIVLLTTAAYYGLLRYAGRSFERRIEIISRRLA